MRRMPPILSLLLGFALLFSQVLPTFAQVDAQEGSTSTGLGSPVPVTNDAGEVVGVGARDEHARDGDGK